MAEDYTRGQMDISQHSATYHGVMGGSVLVGILTAVTVLYLTLVFGAEMGWFNSLIASAAVGGAAGYFLKQGLVYWIALAFFGVVTILSGVFIHALN